MQTPSVGRPCLTGYEIVEETKRYCRGNLVYKRGRGDGRWFEWIKQDEGKGKDDKKETTTAQQRCERGAEEERKYCQQRRAEEEREDCQQRRAEEEREYCQQRRAEEDSAGNRNQRRGNTGSLEP